MPIGIRAKGVDTRIVKIIEDIIEKKLSNALLKMLLVILSSYETSLLSRFRIRPIGTLLKKLLMSA